MKKLKVYTLCTAAQEHTQGQTQQIPVHTGPHQFKYP